MRTVAPPDVDRRPLLAVAVTNLVPLLGVVLWNWNAASLVVCYWLELGIVLAWAVAVAPFAQRPTDYPSSTTLFGAFRDKRGGVDPPGPLPTIPVHNLTPVLVAATVWMAVWLAIGGMSFVALFDVRTTGGIDPSTVAVDTVVLGTLAVFVGRGMATLSEYVLDGQYRETSAGAVIRGAVVPLMGVGIPLILIPRAVDGATAGTLLLVAFVAVKLLVDLADANAERLRAIDERSGGIIGFAHEPPEREAVRTNDEGLEATERPRPLALLVGAAVHATTTGFAKGVGGLGAVWVGVLAISGGDGGVMALFALGVLTCLLLVGGTDYLVRHGAMSYRRGDGVVGYDRLLGEPQWRVEPADVHDLTVEERVVDRLLGSRSLAVETADRTIRLVHLSDAEGFVDAVDPTGGRRWASGRERGPEQANE